MDKDAFDTPLDYKDRRASLIISGIILALIGVGVGLLSAFYILFFSFFSDAMMAAAPPSPAGTPAPTDLFGDGMQDLMVGAGVMYGVVALGFLVIGAGNVFLRRWSRPLALILSSAWIYFGLVSMMWMLVSFSAMREMMYEQMAADGAAPPGMGPDAMVGFMIGFNLVFLFIFGVMLPALIFWLNMSQDAKITLEFCDRKPRWTDRCPVPLLGLAVFAAASGVMTIASAFWIPFMPVFGHVLTGQTARIFWLGIAVVLLVIGWGAYRKMLVAWALALVLVIAGTFSGAVSFRRLDWAEMYDMMGIPIPDDQMLEMTRMMEAMYSGSSMIVAMILAALPVLAYLIWVLRFFKQEPDESASIPATVG